MRYLTLREVLTLHADLIDPELAVHHVHYRARGVFAADEQLEDSSADGIAQDVERMVAETASANQYDCLTPQPVVGFNRPRAARTLVRRVFPTATRVLV